MSEAARTKGGRAAPEAAPAGPHGGSSAPSTHGYRVLARKYRPVSFDQLIGQDAMVRTLRNAFASGRIAQAYILTGVRGVGKTTTARIIARALNYEPPEGNGGPTLDMPTFGRHCEAIMESRHLDVLELDAASHNRVEEIRELIEGAHYRPALARYKVYILDEVHMVTTPAFNALLKTLEEPPPHVKFIFATTEIRKVPVTVLSRCQRFDLRRVDADLIARHLAAICEQEKVTAEPEALALIARAAEGSVRDSLSLLDQAIAHGAAAIEADAVRSLLGLADRARIIDLFEMLMRGDIKAALAEFRSQYDNGADPAVIVADLAEFTHLLTRFKLVPGSADDRSLIEAERVRGRAMAEALSVRVLSRAWQMLSKGLAEVQTAEKPLQAAEMVLVRLAYAADLPTPDEALRALQGDSDPSPLGDAVEAGVSTAPSAQSPGLAVARNAQPRLREPLGKPSAAPTSRLARLEDLAALAATKRDLPIKHAVERYVRPVRIEEGRLEIALEPDAPSNLIGDLSSRLSEWTGRRWLVVLSDEDGGPTLAELSAAQREALARDVRADPLVGAVLARFPGAEIVDVRRRAAPPDEAEGASAPEPPADDDRSEQ